MNASFAQARRFSSRGLLACVVLGALGGVLAILARMIGLALQGVVPWLAFPAPLPWFLGILMAPILVQRAGAALLTSAVTAVVSFGGLALCGGILVEGVFLTARWLRSRRAQAWPAPRSRFWLCWALVAATLIALMSFGFMFLYREFFLLDDGVKALALVVRVTLAVAYGWAAWAAVSALMRAGVNPQRLPAP